MSPALAIARVTLTEQLRNRLYLIILFFGAVMLGVSLLLGTLAPGHSARVIFDVGLVMIELFGLTTAIFGAVTLVIQEIESKTVYLLLTRPLKRSSYILGRFLGLVTAVALTMMVMALLHWLLLLTQENMTFEAVYPVLIMMSIGKMLVITALAVFFSLFASSSVSALIFTGFFWVVGHFTTEMAFLIKRNFTGFAAKIVQGIALVFPNFQYFNFRDLYATQNFAGFEFISWAIVYGVAYTGTFLILAAVLFSRREF